MDLSELAKLSGRQDEGHWHELRDPVHGHPIGVRIRMAGPDSDRARWARDDLELAVSRIPNRGGRAQIEQRQEALDGFLADLVMDWQAQEGGQDVPFSRENFLRVLKAGQWVREQVAEFAGDRRPYFSREA